ncbi:ThuA domain-containing protein [Paenibacillus sp. sptzw28]|uniref:ThuA domain-containing protein n=1 Tax=Paenibacillus sp. sptzw28 TaxID=715179 RepID=UPI001C6E54BA|nr:ThuA domain-containing protein [Paenibacillus sp. sptzw28]QYR21160.1 ThuA domain-containing protein [Paenibacillus sp. sptzw28]
MTEKHILLIGDDHSGAWHPLEPVRQELEQILAGEFQLTVTKNYDDLSSLDTIQYAACISYADIWTRALTSEQIAGLLKFVAGGGGLLAIHNGISLAGSYELLQVMGARFVTHPPYQSLHFYRTMKEHPLLQGVEDFSIDEEPYQFEFDPFTPRTVFLEYEYNGERWPSAWEHNYGLGKVVYLHPGHSANAFRSDAIKRLILNSVRLASGH